MWNRSTDRHAHTHTHTQTGTYLQPLAYHASYERAVLSYPRAEYKSLHVPVERCPVRAYVLTNPMSDTHTHTHMHTTFLLSGVPSVVHLRMCRALYVCVCVYMCVCVHMYVRVCVGLSVCVCPPCRTYTQAYRVLMWLVGLLMPSSPAQLARH